MRGLRIYFGLLVWKYVSPATYLDREFHGWLGVATSARHAWPFWRVESWSTHQTAYGRAAIRKVYAQGRKGVLRKPGLVQYLGKMVLNPRCSLERNMTISPVQLFAHDPASLLPQLKHHLPKSLPVYGCILSNSSSVPTSTSPGHHEPLSTVETSNRLPHAYATFPPSCLSSPPELFAIFVHLPPPMTWQVRFFCSAETRKNLSTSERQTALNLVKDAVTLHLEGPEETRMLGGMSTLWSAGVREMLGTRENEVCDVWLAPEDGAMGEGEVDKEGLEVDEGRRRDCELVRSVNT